jgi:hypothetical protein
VHKIVANKLEEDQVATRELYNSKDWYNKKTLTKDRIQNWTLDKMPLNLEIKFVLIKETCIN